MTPYILFSNKLKVVSRTFILLLAVCLISCGGKKSTESEPASAELNLIQTLDIPSEPTVISTGDLNSDGIDDIVVAYGGSSVNADKGLQVLFGGLNGLYSLHATIDYGFPILDSSIVDFNNDGIKDIIFTDGRQLHLSLANSNFQYQEPTIINKGVSGAILFDLAFINDDQILDMVSWYGQDLHVSLGTSEGSFDAGVLISSDVRGYITSDFDGDGNVDILFKRSSPFSTEIVFGTPDGSFTNQTTIADSNTGTNHLLPGDINGDGWDDVFTVAGNGGGRMNILMSLKNGDFEETLILTHENEFDIDMFYTDKAILLDIDCDNRDDMLVLEFPTNKLKSLISDGTGAFFNGPQILTDNTSVNNILFAKTNPDMLGSAKFIRGLTSDLGIDAYTLEIYGNPACTDF